MKTTTNIIRKVILAAMICIASVATAQTAYKGLRVPQLTTDERTNISAESNSQSAQGQLIFNKETGKLQYWNGSKWVEVDDVNSLLDNDSFVDGMIKIIEKNVEMEETITTLIKNGDGTYTYTNEAGNSITIDTNVTATGKNGIAIEGSGTSNITVKLPDGQDGQILTWNNSVWKAANQTPSVKQATIAVENGTFDTKNLVFYGTTKATTSALKVVSIEPIFSNLAMRRNFLNVEATAQVAGNAADWTVSIENHNIASANKCTLQSVIISYICDAELTGASQGVSEIAGY